MKSGVECAHIRDKSSSSLPLSLRGGVAVAYGMECRAPHSSLRRVRSSPSLAQTQRGSKSEQQATNERGRNQMSYDPGAIMDTPRKRALGLVGHLYNSVVHLVTLSLPC